MELAFRPFHRLDRTNGWLIELFQRHIVQEAEKAGVTLPTLPRRQMSPVDSAINDVRRHLHGLQVTFPDKSARISVCISLKESLQRLEREAAWYSYEPLSRVAAVLHDTLKHNCIEDFDDAQLQGFLEAAKQVVEVSPDQSSPYDCELALFKAGLSWLPTVGDMDEDEVEEQETEG